MSLAVIEHRSSVIPRGKGGIKLIAEDEINRIFRKESLPIGLASSAIPRCIYCFGNPLCFQPLHTKFTHQVQAWKGGWIRFWGQFWSCAPIAKGQITIVEALSDAFSLAFTDVLGDHIGEVGRKGRQDGQLQLALRRRVVNMLGERDKCAMLLGQDAQAL